MPLLLDHCEIQKGEQLCPYFYLSGSDTCRQIQAHTFLKNLRLECSWKWDATILIQPGEQQGMATWLQTVKSPWKQLVCACCAVETNTLHSILAPLWCRAGHLPSNHRDVVALHSGGLNSTPLLSEDNCTRLFPPCSWALLPWPPAIIQS